MKKHMATLIFLSALFVSGGVLAQQSPALSAKSPIPLTKVEGRMDHIGIDVKGQRLFATAFDNHRYDARSKHVVVGYGGEKFLAGKVARPGGGGALAILDSTGKKTGEIPMDAHPESCQLEKTGTRVFVNVPDKQEVEVADLVKGTVLARWPVSCTTNFPMALDEARHRLFVGCRMPARLAVFDTDTGKRSEERRVG